MAQLSNKKEQKEQSIENFLYFVGISLVIGFVPILESTIDIGWFKIIIGLIIVVITIFLIRLIVRASGLKKFIQRSNINLPSLYIAYILLYLVVRTMLKI